MTVNITPLHDRVLVRRLEEKETAKGGIIMIRPKKSLKRAKPWPSELARLKRAIVSRSM